MDRPSRIDARELVPLVYSRLRRVAGAFMRRERRGHSLSPTDVVHEAFLRLVKAKKLTLLGKTHFCAIAAREMRRVLREHAQRHAAGRRGGGVARVSLPEDVAGEEVPVLEILALDEFLEQMSRRSPRRARVVEMRVLAGMTEDEIGHELGVTARTIRADLAAARVRLAQYLGSRRAHAG